MRHFTSALLWGIAEAVIMIVILSLAVWGFVLMGIRDWLCGRTS